MGLVSINELGHHYVFYALSTKLSIFCQYNEGATNSKLLIINIGHENTILHFKNAGWFTGSRLEHTKFQPLSKHVKKQTHTTNLTSLLPYILTKNFVLLLIHFQMTLVSYRLKEYKTPEGFQQSCNMDLRHLYKKVYFNPGLTE